MRNIGRVLFLLMIFVFCSFNHVLAEAYDSELEMTHEQVGSKTEDHTNKSLLNDDGQPKSAEDTDLNSVTRSIEDVASDISPDSFIVIEDEDQDDISNYTVSNEGNAITNIGSDASNSIIDTKPANSQNANVTEQATGIKEEDGALYYVDPSTGTVRAEPGFFTYDGNRYYVQEDGTLAADKAIQVDSHMYHMDKNGVLIKGMHKWNDSSYYYSSPNGGLLRTAAGFINHNNKRYYVTTGGRIATGRTVRIGKKQFHANTSGVIMKGVHKWGDFYFFSESGRGQIRTAAGFSSWNKNRYFISNGGRIVCNQFFRVRGNRYSSYGTGIIATGIYKRNSDYYFSDCVTGKIVEKEGFTRTKYHTYFIDNTGTILTGRPFVYNNNPYVSNSTGCCRRLLTSSTSAVISIAQSQVGIMTGAKYWEWYFGTRFIDTDRTPWCGTFVAWCYKKSGLYGRISAAGNLAYVPCYTQFANKTGTWINKASAASGDIIVFGRDRHVGIVERVYNGYLFTIEGNSGPTAAYGCGKPGAVTRKIYKLSDSDIKGVIHP